MKRFGTVVILVLVFLALGSAEAFALYDETDGMLKEGTCGENLTWKLELFLSEDQEQITGASLIVSGTGPMDDYMTDGAGNAPWYPYADVITEISIPDSVTYIGNYAFYGCGSLSSAWIPCDIGEYTFQHCISLESIVFTEGTRSIGDGAFWNCNHLESIVFPSSLASLGITPFACCGSLKEITVDPACTAYRSVDGVLYDYDGATLICYPAGKGETEYLIPDSVTYIDPQAFQDAASLESVGIPYSLLSVQTSAFMNCDSLKDVYYAGEETEWSTVSILEGNEVLLNAQLHCKPANYSWEIRDGVLTVAGERIPSFPDEGTPWYADREQITGIVVESGITQIGSSAFENCASAEYAELPEGLTDWGAAVFMGCTGLKRVWLPDSLESVHGFMECSSLTDIHIPEHAKTINYFAFRNCTSLKEIVIPEEVTSIRGFAFRMCERLETITLPACLELIDVSAFDGCTSLKDVYFTGTEAEWRNVCVRDGNEPLLNAALHFAGE